MIENEAFNNVKIYKNSNSAIRQTRFPKKVCAVALQTDPIKKTHHNLILLLTNLEKDLPTFDKLQSS